MYGGCCGYLKALFVDLWLSETIGSEALPPLPSRPVRTPQEILILTPLHFITILCNNRTGLHAE
jgi:hypothetical protein